MAPTSPSQSRPPRHPLNSSACRPRLWSASLLMVGALMAGCSDGSDEAAESQSQEGGQATEVEAVTVKMQDVPITSELPGRISAYQIAEVRPQVGGIIESRDFTEGSEVEEGQVLYHIDARTYRADVASAKASLARAEASLNTSNLQAKRFKTLVARNLVSQQDYDDAVATVGEDRADVASAKADVSSAQINLDYTTVTSPISGRIGKSSVTKGALVTASQDTSLVTVQQLDPIYVDMTQSASETLKLKRELSKNGKAAAAPDKAKVELLMDKDDPYQYQGELQFTDISVDEGTGMVTLRALFPNPDTMLLPGMFVTARMVEAVAHDAILLPQKAVSHNDDGDATTMVINAEGKVESRVVKIDRAMGNQWLVTDGLSAGEQVITSGLQKIKAGAPVRVAKDDATENDATADAGQPGEEQ